MSDYIISRKDAISMGISKYFTGVPCKNGHTTERYVSNHKCLGCQKERAASDKRKSYIKEYREKNKDKIKEYSHNYYQNNKHWLKPHRKIYSKKWQKENKALLNFYNSRYRAAKLQATLEGYDEELLQIYEESATRRSSGEDVHVDHIVPLQGDTVSGLHVPWNLQIIPAEENISKSNRLLEHEGREN